MDFSLPFPLDLLGTAVFRVRPPATFARGASADEIEFDRVLNRGDARNESFGTGAGGGLSAFQH